MSGVEIVIGDRADQIRRALWPDLYPSRRAETIEIVGDLMRFSRMRGYTVQVYFADGVHRTEEELDCFEVITRDGVCEWKVVIGHDGTLQRVYPCRVCDWSKACGDPPGSECHS